MGKNEQTIELLNYIALEAMREIKTTPTSTQAWGFYYDVWNSRPLP